MAVGGGVGVVPIWMVDGKGRARRVPHVWTVEITEYGRDRPRATYMSTASGESLALPVARNLGPGERGVGYKDGRRTCVYLRIGDEVLRDDEPIYRIGGDGLLHAVRRKSDI